MAPLGAWVHAPGPNTGWWLVFLGRRDPVILRLRLSVLPASQRSGLTN